MLKVLSAAATALALIATSPAAAATLVIDGSGHLTGATGVNVGGTLYDVTFQDGTCGSVFGACDAANFAFNSSGAADLAAQALLDQVFVDGLLGQFDSNPALTVTCLSLTACQFAIPYAVQSSFVYFSAPVNYSAAGDQVNSSTFQVDLNLIADPNTSFAKFTLSAVPSVPEPATWAMMLLGFGGIGLTMSHKKAGQKLRAVA